MKRIFLIKILLFVILTSCRNPWQEQAATGEITGNFSRTAAALNIYYGILHNHSSYSDGTGTPMNAYTYARDTAHLDFFSLADHAESLTGSEWSSLKSTADSFNRDGTFVAFCGFEWSHNTYGHVTVINSTDICNAGQSATNTFSELVSWLNSREAIAFFNHPGRQNSTGTEFNHFTSPPSDRFVGMELWNKNNGFNIYYYNDGYYSGKGNKGFYDEALSRGWAIGASGSDDNHDGTFGTRNDYRMAVIADSLTKTSLYNAMKARHFYSTGDKNLKLSFLMNGNQMGATIAAGSCNVEISAYDNENFSRIDLLKNGTVIQTWNINSSEPEVTCTLTTTGGEYYYARVRQADGEEAVSSPVHITSSSATPAQTAVSTPTGTTPPGATGTPAPAPADTIIFEKRISAGMDDVEERSNGTMYTNSSDLEMVYDSGNQHVGMRFTDIALPGNAIVTEAYIQFKVDETGSPVTNLTIKGQDTADAPAFTSSTNDLSSRQTTEAVVDWSPSAWNTVGAAGTDQRTPDISTIIREISGNPGWVSGNSMVIIITGTGERVAESYDGDRAGAPLLHIEYSLY